MKKTILLFIIGVFPMIGYAQATETLYFTFTSKPGDDWKNRTEGIYRRITIKNDPLYKTSPIHFIMKSVPKGVDLSFAHIDYNLTELAKNRQVHWSDSPEIRVEPKSFLNTVTVQDLNQILQGKTQQQLWDWFRTLRGKRIYFIDKNDETATTVKLIQVHPMSDGRPYSTTTIVEVDEEPVW